MLSIMGQRSKAHVHWQSVSIYKYCSMRAHKDGDGGRCISNVYKKIRNTERIKPISFSKVSEIVRHQKCLKLPVKSVETRRKCKITLRNLMSELIETCI